MYSYYNLILQKFFYMFRPMKIHSQEVNFGVPALWYDVMAFKSMWS